MNVPPIRKSSPRRIAVPQLGVEGETFHLRSQWWIEEDVRTVADLFLHPERAAEWWPASFLRLEIVQPVEDRLQRGMVARVLVKGWIPYTLQFLIRVEDARYPDRFSIEVCGDMNGWMAVTLAPGGAGTAIDFDWRIAADHAFVREMARRFRWFRPILMSNHHFSMSRGERSLKGALRCLRGEAAFRPPGPVFPHNLRLVRESIRWRPWTQSWEAAKRHRARKGAPG